jgi:hypothetical protein
VLRGGGGRSSGASISQPGDAAAATAAQLSAAGDIFSPGTAASHAGFSAAVTDLRRKAREQARQLATLKVQLALAALRGEG